MQNHRHSQPVQVQPPALAQIVSAGARAPASALSSDELLRGNRSVDISHNGSVYRLQATRLGKLILTK